MNSDPVFCFRSHFFCSLLVSAQFNSNRNSMLTKKAKALMLFLLLALASGTSANIQIGFSFEPELLVGSDDQQLVGSIWTFSINVSQPTYADLGGVGLPYATPDTVTLTVSGSGISANNGIFNVIQNGPKNIGLVPSNGTYAYPLITDDGFEFFNVFEFGDNVLVSDFNPVGTPVSTPIVGDPLLAEHFDGVTLTNALGFRTTGDPFGNTQYGVPSGTKVTATSIPEPSALMITLVFTITMHARRKK